MGGPTAGKQPCISSTFVDTQTERDAIQREIIPNVRGIAARLGISINCVDMRFG